MSLTLELPTDLETRLAAEAAQGTAYASFRTR